MKWERLQESSKEVYTLKKILFLIMASLLVLALALPGCGGTGQQEEEEEEEEQGLTIQIAIVGPMGFIQGDNMWYGVLSVEVFWSKDGGSTNSGLQPSPAGPLPSS